MRLREHTSPRHPPALIVCLVIAAVFGLTASSALAKTFTVNKHGDHAPGKCNAADCTLREAVMAATAKPSDDKVELPSNKPYKLKRDPSLPGPDEANGDLDVGVAIGPGNRTKVVHPGSGRATIDPSATGDRAIELVGNLELRRIKLKGGIAEHGEQSGGAINARGALILHDSVVRGNIAPDVGGGIYIHSGVLILDRTRFRGNSAGNGGAFFVGEAANVELTDSTVDGNSATGSGGAAWIETGLFFGSSRIVRSTFSGNESGGDGGAVYADSPTSRPRTRPSRATRPTAGAAPSTRPRIPTATSTTSPSPETGPTPTMPVPATSGAGSTPTAAATSSRSGTRWSSRTCTGPPTRSTSATRRPRWGSSRSAAT